MTNNRFDLMYVSCGSFWKNACIKPYQHHDILLKYVNRILPLNIHIALPMSGETYFKDLLNTGNQSKVMSTWQELPYKVYPKLYDGPIDGMLINGNGSTWDYVLPDGTEISAKEACDYLVEKAIYCKDNNLPVILFDPDNFVNFMDGKNDEASTEDTNYTYRIYNELKDYDKFTLASPFEYGTSVHHKSEIFIPFTLDKEINTEIKKFSERNYFTKYVGSNYHRDHFVEYFNKCSKYGNVQVVGSGWSKYKKQYPNINWKFKFPLTTEKVYDYYSDSKFALYGTTKDFSKHGHYTLRIREFYEAGVFVIPENLDYMVNSICLEGDHKFTIDDIMENRLNNYFSSELINRIDDLYEKLVKEQRQKLIKKFDAEQYARKVVELLNG